MQFKQWFSILTVTALAAVLVTAACAQVSSDEEPVNSELQYIDHRVGEGEEAVVGATVEVHYTGWLWNDGERGTVFDSSLERGVPFSFVLGARRVIAGWDQGVQGMRVGGVRELIIPPDLGYGDRGAGGVIPPNATLNFQIELLKVLP